ncbi:DUF2157 domain-containing protein [Sphingorhabdus sp.]|uniref:DUF2157 domain-containing protein n=1 Tax=Sphingorhabdus sp. TaxID=1902408 RepID=UPI003C756624
MSERKLKAWQEAGLIDAPTADRIRIWEAQHERPLALWSIVGIAALAIALGLISVVAANWDAIPGTTRLAIHLALLAGMAALLWWKRDAHPMVGETGIFLFAALGLTFFGHTGQVYQTSAPLWQPLAAWLLLFTPIMLLFGRGWLSATGWFVGLAGTLQAYADYRFGFGNVDVSPALWGTLTALPILVVAAAAAMRSRSTRPDFWRRLEQIALIYTVAGTSLLLIASGFGDGPWESGDGKALTACVTQSAIAALAAAFTFILRPSASGKSVALVLAASAVVNLLGYTLADKDVAAAILFMLFWLAIAAAALRGGWRPVFQFAVAVIALRLIILSFELADDLLGSGLGLILAGLLTLANAFAAVKVSKRFAPKDEPETAEDKP